MRVLVTGGSRGIGAAICRDLVEDHAVGIGYHRSSDAARDLQQELEGAPGNAVAVQGDVSDPESAAALVRDTADALGGLDAVINNAGIVDPARADAISPDQWQSVIETNLSGAFYVTQAALSYVEPDGDVVFMSSIGGTAGTVDPSYAASKAGLHGLMRALAREYGDDGLQVNAIAPGPVETELNADIVAYLESIEFRGHEGVDTHLPTYACDPAEVARAVRYVLESEYLQGELINLNGGMQFR